MPTMRYPLTMVNLLERSHKMFPRKEIVSRTASGVIRHTYADNYRRVCQLAHALQDLGVGRGDKVATFAWNHHRHLETYLAAPCMGAIIHTVNIRLPEEHIVHILNHAEDKVLLVDEDLLPVILPLRDQFKTVKHIIVMSDEPANVPDTLDYETLIRDQPTSFPWPQDIDEWEPAGLCFTSATTGTPKGVQYAHRGLYLHTMALCMTDVFAVGERDTIMPVVPMFHVNAWCLPFAATWTGAKLVLPGPRPTAEVIAKLIHEEKITVAGAVPTVWLNVLHTVDKDNYDLSSLTRIISGGTPVPRSLADAYRKRWNVPILQIYGMTEASPITHVGVLKSHMYEMDVDQQQDFLDLQGLLVPGLEMRVVDDNGEEVPWDFKSTGEVLIRGPWIASEYFKDDRSKSTFIDGWYHTGDIAVVHPEGYLKIVDRQKDVIKSGGEWISSLDLENAVMAFPGVAEAAVIGCLHPVWDERPLACVVPLPDTKIEPQAIVEFLKKQFPSYWVPDSIQIIDDIPKTGTGKFDKKLLRERFQDIYLNQQKTAGMGD